MSLLPFMKNKSVSGSIMTTKMRAPDAPEEVEKSNSSIDEGLLAASRDLISAIGTGDEKLVAQALQAAFEIIDSQPHEEGPHPEEESEQS